MATYEITGIISTGYKSAYQQGYSDAMYDFRKKSKTDVLDKIRAEIEELKPNNPNFKGYFEQNVALNKALDIIDKYREVTE